MPMLWYYEMRSLILIQERRGRMNSQECDAGLLLLRSLPIELDTEENDRALFRLARRHGLTGYDTTYIELALRTDLPLATLDKALIAAAKNEGITLLA